MSRQKLQRVPSTSSSARRGELAQPLASARRRAQVLVELELGALGRARGSRGAGRSGSSRTRPRSAAATSPSGASRRTHSIDVFQSSWTSWSSKIIALGDGREQPADDRLAPRRHVERRRSRRRSRPARRRACPRRRDGPRRRRPGRRAAAARAATSSAVLVHELERQAAQRVDLAARARPRPCAACTAARAARRRGRSRTRPSPWSSGVCVRMTLGGNSAVGLGPDDLAVERDLVRRRRARREPGHVHERVVVALDAERAARARLDALGADLDFARRRRSAPTSSPRQSPACRSSGPSRRCHRSFIAFATISGVRIALIPLPAPVLAGCGGDRRPTSRFGEVALELSRAAERRRRGRVLRHGARPTTRAKASSWCCQGEGDADFRIIERPPEGCIAVLAVVRPDKLRAVRGRGDAPGRAGEGARRRARAAARLPAGAARARRGGRRR